MNLPSLEDRRAATPHPTRSAVASGVILALISLPTLAANGAELIVIEDPRCAPCILFERQVGSIYPKTQEGRLAPLRRIEFGAPIPAPYAFVDRPEVAPTFVLVHQGREVGRFVGYFSDELFWMSLSSLMQKLPEPP